jgi:hypothetical protein
LLRYAQVARVLVDDIINDHSELVFGRRKRPRQQKMPSPDNCLSCPKRSGFENRVNRENEIAAVY